MNNIQIAQQKIRELSKQFDTADEALSQALKAWEASPCLSAGRKLIAAKQNQDIISGRLACQVYDLLNAGRKSTILEASN